MFQFNILEKIWRGKKQTEDNSDDEEKMYSIKFRTKSKI